MNFKILLLICNNCRWFKITSDSIHKCIKYNKPSNIAITNCTEYQYIKELIYV